MFDTLPRPHDLDAERAILGGVFVNNALLDAALEAVRLEDFYRETHRRIFGSMLRLREQQVAIDLVTVKADLRRTGEMPEQVSEADIFELLPGTTVSTNVEYYGRIVRNKADLRATLRAAHSLERFVFEQEPPTAEAAVQFGMQQLLQVHSLDSGGLVGFAQLSSDTLAWLEEVQTRRNSRALSGVDSGFPDLDRMTDGFQPGDLIIVAARPSQGKSAIATQIGLAAEGCSFFSLEMQRPQLAARALATIAMVDGWRLRRGKLTEHEYTRVSAAQTTLADSRLAIDDSADLTVSQIRSRARRWKAEYGLNLVVVDYLQLVTPPRREARRRDSNREQEIAAITRALKATAKELNVPVVALAQLNRNVEKNTNTAPQLSDLRESGEIEQSADVVLFIHRPDGKTAKDAGDVSLIIAKHRNGPTGTVVLHWYPEQTRFASKHQPDPSLEYAS